MTIQVPVSPPSKPLYASFEMPPLRTPPKPYPYPTIEGWDTETRDTGHAQIVSTSKRSAVVDSLDDILLMLSGNSGRGKTNFWWNIDFDVTAMMKWDLDFLEELTTNQEARYGHYKVSYIPKKMLKVRGKSGGSTHYDALQFYRQGLAKAARIYLDREAPEIKQHRDDLWNFPWSEIEAYCQWDATATRDLAALYVASLHKMGLYPRRFISNGNLAQQFILTHGDVPTWADQPKAVNHAAWLSTRGALIDVWKRGTMDVWKYDLKSAYPAIMMDLPDFRNGRWVPRLDDHHRWGIVNVTLTMTESTPPIVPTFNGRHQIYPQWGRVECWLTLDELRVIAPTCEDIEINLAWCFEPEGDRKPWRELLMKLMKMKDEAKGDPARYVAVKALINSFYGKTVQRVRKGDRTLTGPLFNPVAGTLTLGSTRALIAEAVIGHMDDVAIVATDSLAFTKPVDHLDVGDRVGQWECETVDQSGRPTPKSAIIAHPGIYQVDGERTHTRGFKAVRVPDLSEACRYYGTVLPVTYDRPYTSREAVHHGRIEDAGRFLPHTYRVPIRNTRRLWHDAPKSYVDLLDNVYESSPVPSEIMEGC